MTEFDWKRLTHVLVKLFAYPAFIMLLWNWFMDSLFGLPHINYWEALGIRLLVGMLFHEDNALYLEEIMKKMK